jgi:hypothetical protein
MVIAQDLTDLIHQLQVSIRGKFGLVSIMGIS